MVSFFFLSFSSPNLSGRRLDVYHTSTHGVALVRIWNAGLKRAARGSLEMQDPKNRHLHLAGRPFLGIGPHFYFCYCFDAAVGRNKSMLIIIDTNV